MAPDTFIGTSHSSTKGVAPILPGVCSRFCLRAEWSAKLLASGELQYIVGNGCPFRTAFRAGLNVYVGHYPSSVALPH